MVEPGARMAILDELPEVTIQDLLEWLRSGIARSR